MIISRVVLKEVAEVVLKEEEEHVADEVVEEEEDIKMTEKTNNLSPNKVGKTLLHLTQTSLSVLQLKIIPIVTQHSQVSAPHKAKVKSYTILSSISSLKL